MNKATDPTHITGEIFKNWLIRNKYSNFGLVAENLGIEESSLKNNYFPSIGLTYNVVRSILVAYPKFPIQDMFKVTGAFFKEWLIRNGYNDFEKVAKNLGVDKHALFGEYFASKGLTYSKVQEILEEYSKFPFTDMYKVTGRFFKEWLIRYKHNDFKKVAKNLGIDEKSLVNYYFNSAELSFEDVELILKVYPHFPYEYQLSDFGFAYKWRTNSNINLFSFPPFKKKSKNYDKEIEGYFKKLIDLVNETQKGIAVYDYLVKGDNQDLRQSSAILNGQKDYLQAIFNRCKERKIKYSRIIVLPKGLQKDTPKNIATSIPLLLVESFKHILKCFEELGDQFNLFFCTEPVIPYSIGYFDKNKIILELHKYEDTGAFPDKSIILHATGHKRDKILADMLSVEAVEIDRMLEQGKNTEEPFIEIDLEMLFWATKLALGNTKQNLATIKRQNKKLKNDSNNFNSPDVKKIQTEFQASLKDIRAYEYEVQLMEQKNELILKYEPEFEKDTLIDWNLSSKKVTRIGEKIESILNELQREGKQISQNELQKLINDFVIDFTEKTTNDIE